MLQTGQGSFSPTSLGKDWKRSRFLTLFDISFSVAPASRPALLNFRSNWIQKGGLNSGLDVMRCTVYGGLFCSELKTENCPICPKTVTFSFQGNVNIQGNYFIVDINQNWEFLWSWLLFYHFCKYTFTNFTDFANFSPTWHNVNLNFPAFLAPYFSMGVVSWQQKKKKNQNENK